MNKETFNSALVLQKKAAKSNKKVEIQARKAAIKAMKKLFNIDVKAEQTADKNINYFFNTNSIWAYDGWVTVQKHDDLSGGLVKEYEISLPDLFSE